MLSCRQIQSGTEQEPCPGRPSPKSHCFLNSTIYCKILRLNCYLKLSAFGAVSISFYLFACAPTVERPLRGRELEVSANWFVLRSFETDRPPLIGPVHSSKKNIPRCCTLGISRDNKKREEIYAEFFKHLNWSTLYQLSINWNNKIIYFDNNSLKNWFANPIIETYNYL